jgi:siroheme synthase
VIATGALAELVRLAEGMPQPALIVVGDVVDLASSLSLTALLHAA